MNIDSTLDVALEEFKGSGRIVIAGASLAGLRASEAYQLLHEGRIQGRALITPNG